MTVRWVLSDPATSESWTMPINPNEMTSPNPQKALRHSYGSRWRYRPESREKAVSFLQPPSPVQWEWAGVIRSEEHYDAYVHWASKSAEIHVTDHLGRTWEVFITAFDPEERKPTPHVPWRLRYRVKALLTRRVS